MSWSIFIVWDLILLPTVEKKICVVEWRNFFSSDNDKTMESSSSSPTDPIVIGASMLPFSVDPFYNGLYFLLAKERGGSWRGASKWDDFGGKANVNEDPCDVAAREFQEESCGVVSMFDNEPIPRRSFELIADMLRSRSYMMHIDFQPDEKKRLVYRTYVKQVPWQPEVAQKFGMLMNELVSLKNGRDVSISTFNHPAVYNITEDRSGVKVHDAFLEKQQLAYWSIPQLRAALQKPKRLIQIRHGRKEMLRENFSRRLATILGQFRSDSISPVPNLLPVVKQQADSGAVIGEEKDWRRRRN